MINKKNNCSKSSKAKINFLAFGFWLLAFGLNAQVNCIANGGFEYVSNCGDINGSFITEATPWDTLKNGGGGGYPMNTCFYPNQTSCAPANLNGGGYQQPRTGDGYLYLVYLKYTPNPTVNWRWYAQQKMTHKLTTGKSYCVTYWASLINYVNYAVDELGAYFDDGSIQSIAWSKEAPANPQVKSPSGVFYMDTLNWMKVQGTFVANGTEEYITLGNFRYTAATTFTALDGNNTAGIASYFIDDVSVIETDLPAYAGPDIWGIPTNTVYLGREREIGLDDDCFWYKLPNTTTAIDTAAGTTITVATTTETYMVKQDICGNIKYDTVVVYASGVGISEIGIIKNNVVVYPSPANDILNVEIPTPELISKIKIINGLGQIMREEDISTTKINIKDLPNGVYFINLKSCKLGTANKKFIVSH